MPGSDDDRTGRRLLLRVTIGLALMGVVNACQPRATKLGGDEDLPQDQWSRGVWLYGQHCAGCHGDDGEGDEDTPALAGEGALPRDPAEGSERSVIFDDAADLHAYVSVEMPPLAPGSLSQGDYWAITHYLLKQAGIDPGTEDLGPDQAGTVELR